MIGEVGIGVRIVAVVGGLILAGTAVDAAAATRSGDQTWTTGYRLRPSGGEAAESLDRGEGRAGGSAVTGAPARRYAQNFFSGEFFAYAGAGGSDDDDDCDRGEVSPKGKKQKDKNKDFCHEKDEHKRQDKVKDENKKKNDDEEDDEGAV